MNKSEATAMLALPQMGADDITDLDEDLVVAKALLSTAAWRTNCQSV